MSKNTVNIKSSARWIAETAVMLALLVTLQYLTKPLGQFVTGSCVNAVLALTVLLAGQSSGFAVALISPWLAFILGIAPMPFVVPAIMVGNLVYVELLHQLADPKGKNILRQSIAWLVAAACKFAILFLVVHKFLKALLPAPKAPQILAMFSWPQLVTALIGGAVALLLVPVLKKALKK